MDRAVVVAAVGIMAAVNMEVAEDMAVAGDMAAAGDNYPVVDFVVAAETVFVGFAGRMVVMTG